MKRAIFLSGWLACLLLIVLWVGGQVAAQDSSDVAANLRLWESDGTIRDFQCAERPQGPLATPEGETATPAPQATFTPVPSTTPTLPAVPSPTALPLCWGVVTANTLNIRSGHGTSFEIKGQYIKGDRIGLLELIAGTSTGDWYKVSGNPALYVSATYVEIGAEAVCSFAPPKTAWGLWIGPGAWLNEILEYGDRSKAAGIQPAATLYGNETFANILYDRGWVVAARPWIGDCPVFNMGAERSAFEWVDKAAAALDGVRYTWLVLSNECAFPTPQYAHDWIQAAIIRANERQIDRLVPVVWPPGHPELSDVPLIASAYENAPISLAWCMNLYPTIDGMKLATTAGLAAFTTWRYKLYRNQLPAGLPLCATEIAAGQGNEPPDFADIQRFKDIAGNDLLWGTLWYDAMALSHWQQATLRGKVDQIVVK